MTLRIFIGMDDRQPVAAQVLAHSVYMRATKPVEITMLRLQQLPITRAGLTSFTFARYLCPHLCGFTGMSLFLDADMLCLGDVAELFALYDGHSDVMVVKNPKPELRFEWPSLMLFSNARCRALTVPYVDDPQSDVAGLGWAREVGELPAAWNRCIGYDAHDPDTKLAHFTGGIPLYKDTRDLGFGEQWWEEYARSMHTVPWEELLGMSKHAKMVQNARR